MFESPKMRRLSFSPPNFADSSHNHPAPEHEIDISSHCIQFKLIYHIKPQIYWLKKFFLNTQELNISWLSAFELILKFQASCEIYQALLPLRFRKAGKVWCGGARETYWATCHNEVTVSKMKQSLRSPYFSRSLC